MALQSIAARLRTHFRDFLRARDGNIAVILAFASVPAVGLMGAAVDYSRANAVKADLQSAIDASALFVSKNAATQTNDQLQASAKAHVLALFRNAEAYTPTVSATYSPSTSTVTVNANTKVNSDFMGYFGMKTIPIDGTASVSWGTNRLRVALALDNTGSMATNNKMTALKAASKNLLKQLESAAKSNGDVYVSIVPFAKVVNVGKDKKDSSWLNLLGMLEPVLNGAVKANGTIDVTKVNVNANLGTFNLSDINLSGLNLTNLTVTSLTNYLKTIWNGCVTDRDHPYDTTGASPDVNQSKTLFPAVLDSTACPEQLMPMSYDWTALKNKIDAMQPNGNTNVTIGLEWAWHSLTQGAPLFPPSEQPNVPYTKVIILLTDGDNTANRFTNQQNAIDPRTKMACENAKKEGIIIYSVLVMQGSQQLLQQCATDANKYFYLQSADGLVSVFNKIGTDLSSLRVSK